LQTDTIQNEVHQLYRIQTSGFDCCGDIIEPITSVLVIAQNETEARRLAFLYAFVEAEKMMEIREWGEEHYDLIEDLIKIAEEKETAYAREADKFLDADQSRITRIGTMIDVQPDIIDATQFCYS